VPRTSRRIEIDHAGEIFYLDPFRIPLAQVRSARRDGRHADALRLALGAEHYRAWNAVPRRASEHREALVAILRCLIPAEAWS
jgi:hypothetical protein